MTVHLAHRDTTLVAISRAPLAEIQRFKQRMGWQFNWVSSYGSDFNFDYGVSFTPQEQANNEVTYNYGKQPFESEEMPGVSVFFRSDAGEIFHTYSTYRRGVEVMMGTYNLLDLTPMGRNERDVAYKMEWVRHHGDRGCSAQALRALLPIALGHAASVAVVTGVVAQGLALDRALFQSLAGALLVGAASYRLVRSAEPWAPRGVMGDCDPRGRAPRAAARLHKRAGHAGIALWSFLMATAHGAGLMLVPALVPLCVSGGPAREITASGSLLLA